MKNILLLSLFMTIASTGLIAQEAPKFKLEPAPEGKSVVYFVRTSSLGFAINFNYFDKDKAIGKFNGPKYMRYECEPGEHLFWAATENRDFVDAELEPGKIYFIMAVPQMGAMKAGVRLEPINPSDSAIMKKVKALMMKKPSETFEPAELEAQTKKQENVIKTGLAKYEEVKVKGTKIEKLTKDMYYKEEE